MPEAPSLAVIIPAYNAERFLERAVESVFATGYPGIEVAIVDDGSTDGTLAVARNLERRWAGRCKVLRHPNSAQMGVSASRNLGIEATTSEWLAFLDADDEFLPNRFEDFLATLKVDASFDGIYGTSAICVESGGVTPTPTVVEVFGIRKPLTGIELLGALLEGVTWQFGAVTIRRTLVTAAGLFDQEKSIAEDCHLAFKMASVGRIIPGDLTRPISRYWRHGTNTYTYRVDHRLALLHAMLDAEEWCRDGRSPDGILRLYRERTFDYASRTLDAAAAEGRIRLVFLVIRIMFARRPLPTLSRWRFFRQILGALRKSGSCVLRSQ